MLEYESSLTRKLTIPKFARTVDGDKEGYYCTSAHFVVRVCLASGISANARR